MEKSLQEIRCLLDICWEQEYQPSTIDIAKDKYTVRYRLVLNSLFVPDNSPFSILNE